MSLFRHYSLICGFSTFSFTQESRESQERVTFWPSSSLDLSEPVNLLGSHFWDISAGRDRPQTSQDSTNRAWLTLRGSWIKRLLNHLQVQSEAQNTGQWRYVWAKMPMLAVRVGKDETDGSSWKSHYRSLCLGFYFPCVTWKDEGRFFLIHFPALVFHGFESSVELHLPSVQP